MEKVKVWLDLFEKYEFLKTASIITIILALVILFVFVFLLQEGIIQKIFSDLSGHIKKIFYFIIKSFLILCGLLGISLMGFFMLISKLFTRRTK